jgi:hypothetical protein
LRVSDLLLRPLDVPFLNPSLDPSLVPHRRRLVALPRGLSLDPLLGLLPGPSLDLWPVLLLLVPLRNLSPVRSGLPQVLDLLSLLSAVPSVVTSSMPTPRRLGASPLLMLPTWTLATSGSTLMVKSSQREISRVHLRHSRAMVVPEMLALSSRLRAVLEATQERDLPTTEPYPLLRPRTVNSPPGNNPGRRGLELGITGVFRRHPLTVNALLPLVNNLVNLVVNNPALVLLVLVSPLPLQEVLASPLMDSGLPLPVSNPVVSRAMMLLGAVPLVVLSLLLLPEVSVSPLTASALSPAVRALSLEGSVLLGASPSAHRGLIFL